jgi:hypothetical protein
MLESRLLHVESPITVALPDQPKTAVSSTLGKTHSGEMSIDGANGGVAVLAAKALTVSRMREQSLKEEQMAGRRPHSIQH